MQYGGLAVYTGNAHPAFARDICRTLEMPLGPIDVFKFANDNIFVKINDNVREHDVYIVQSLTVGAGVGVSDAIMELLIMIDAFKRASAARITAVMPYYAYGRSDKKDQPRVPITARLLADLITVAGADRFLTMDMHQMQIQGFFGIPGDELSARNELVNYLRTIVEKDKDNFALVVPDLGYANQARRIGELLDVPLVFMQKTHRDNSGRSEIVGVIGDIDRRRAIIIDDEIDRGTTVLNTVRVLQERGVSEIWVACTHPVLSGDAAEKLLASGIVELVTTDTCPLRPSVRNDPRIHVLTVAPLFAEAIRRIHEGESVGALFNPPGLQLPLQVT
ncbi:MAG TPA: ribose-phosphate diphosphokinase [Methylomirabilota bacterium]|nr:ribose-phosphate diphosphokinase [Methylomirabilota bacterium]